MFTGASFPLEVLVPPLIMFSLGIVLVDLVGEPLVSVLDGIREV